MKNKKLSLSNLKIDSFVTSLEDKNTNTIKGGNTTMVCLFLSASVVVASVVVSVIFTPNDANGGGDGQGTNGSNDGGVETQANPGCDDYTSDNRYRGCN